MFFSCVTYADDLNKKFFDQGCNLTSRSWKIVSKADKNVYEIRIDGGRYRKDELGFLILPSLEYKSQGSITDHIFVEKVKTTKGKDKNGFDIEATMYKESARCKKIWFDNFAITQILTLSYPRLHEYEKSKLKIVEQERAKEEEKRKSEAETAKKKKIKAQKKRAKQRKKLESLYE